MSKGSSPDFGAVILRHSVDPTERVRLVWIVLGVFLNIVMLGAGLFFDPRPRVPQPVYIGMWALFAWALVRAVFARSFASPSTLLERGIFLPVYRPIHRLRLGSRALPYASLKRVRLDATSFRSGVHVFETDRGVRRCHKAYLPPARRLAAEIKALAPDVEVVFVDAKGRRKRYAPLVSRRRDQEPEGPRAEAK